MELASFMVWERLRGNITTVWKQVGWVNLLVEADFSWSSKISRWLTTNHSKTGTRIGNYWTRSVIRIMVSCSKNRLQIVKIIPKTLLNRSRWHHLNLKLCPILGQKTRHIGLPHTIIYCENRHLEGWDHATISCKVDLGAKMLICKGKFWDNLIFWRDL